METRQKTTGWTRIVRAIRYSMNGLKACYRYEQAFRQELLLFVILLPVIALLELTDEFRLLLLAVNTLVLVAELFNSALEAIVDKTSPEYDALAGRAKDMGSAAVFLCLCLALTTWVYAIIAALS